MEIKKNDSILLTGFSPAKFILPEGNYQIRASNYQNYVFENWQDGETAKYHGVIVTGPAEFADVYRNGLADFRVEGFDNLDHTIKGMHVSVIRDGNTVAEGFTPI